ncbi:Alpha-L-fucosidase [Novipirellula artificiosorum]|uniref:Alpha-L-fucosidase n=2 Tax=Novipirellula artificiosorum TaxID=2528016 RepID=A0A5C6DSJ3_9BACT|nr:Alpha-L-fucosidase [Novipirellula artificiosorum]
MVSDYNIVDYTPFKRDIIKELSEACHRQGLRFGVYYSQAQDWDEPDAPLIVPSKEKFRWDVHLPVCRVHVCTRMISGRSIVYKSGSPTEFGG